MNNLIESLIRTLVPIGVGGVIAWLTLEGVDISDETSAALTIGLIGLLQAGYYAAFRALETRWPGLGWFLGLARQPEYTGGDDA